MKKVLGAFFIVVVLAVMAAYFIQDQGAKNAAQRAREIELATAKKDAPRPPTENPPGLALSLKEALKRSEERSGRKNLLFYSYEAWQVASDGRALNYKIGSYDKTAKQIIYLWVDRLGSENLDIIERPQGLNAWEAGKIKDSLELAKEALAKYQSCEDSLDIKIAGEKASISCLAPSWQTDLAIVK